jgi:predicted O-methyltransferase YrrM
VGLLKNFKRFNVPNKRTALKYVLADPKLLLALVGKTPKKLHLGLPGSTAKYHFSSVMERALDHDVVTGLHALLPDDIQEYMEEQNERDKQGYRLLMYLLVRSWKPDLMIETGVSRGLSSVYILAAMRENGRGRLISIDLPPDQAALDDESDEKFRYVFEDGQRHAHYDVGHLVPDWLRDRWTLILEDATVALPRVLEEEGEIDLFFHDSMHTEEHMRFEFETVWPHIKEGGWLLSDDAIWNKAFLEIAKRNKTDPIMYRSFGMAQKKQG